MATRQITINDGSKGREQVDFDLNPLTLRSTITNGGNYNVSAAPMPLTSQAYQLSESLKRLPALGQQFAKIQQGIGQERADLIQGADAEEELNRLKEEEPETFFNFMRRKAYSDSLIEKHVRTQMVPNTLNGLKKSADARVFQNENDFNANIDEQLSSSWQEFEQSVGEDVANSVTGKTIWNNLADQMRVEAQASYYESQDAVALENNLESIEHRIASQLSPVDAEGNARDVDPNFVAKLTKTAIPELMEKHGMSRKDASNHLRKIMATRLKIEQVEGKNLRVLDLAEAMERTVSDDGVPIYEGDSATSLLIAETVATARAEIEKQEEDENDIDQQMQKKFVGANLGAYGQFEGGTRWEEMTPIGHQLVLAVFQDLDPTFTMEKLSDRMKPQEAGQVGGGLEVFTAIMDEIAVNGSDRAQSLIEMTRNATNMARISAGQIKGEPSIVLGSVERGNVERQYRDAAMADPKLTLQQFLKKQNILGWDALTVMEAKLADVNTLMLHPVYGAIEEKTSLAIDGIYESYTAEDAAVEIGQVTKADVATYIDSFSTQIQNVMKEEAEAKVIKPSVTAEEKEAGIKTFEERRKELVATMRKSMELILKSTEGEDINFQEQDKFSDEIGSKELLQDTVSDKFRVKRQGIFETLNPFNAGKRGVEAGEPLEELIPFKTNESRGKEVKERKDKNAFGFVPLYEKYMTAWSYEDIQADRAEMIKRIDSSKNSNPYKEQLAYSLFVHGLDLTDELDKSISLMETAGVDAKDVPLFTEPQQALAFGQQVSDVVDKILAVETLTDEEIKLVEHAKFLGLIVEGRVDKKESTARLGIFVNEQYQLIK